MRHGMPPILKMQSLGIEPSLSIGRGVHADGGLLHPDALRHDHAAHAREPDDPRHRDNLRSAEPLADAGPRHAAAARRRATCCASPPSTARRTCGSTARPARSRPARRPTSSSSTPPRINVAPLNHVPGAVVSLMERTNVETVIVAGKVRKWKGKLLDVDLRPAAPAARGLARLHLQRGGHPAGSVQQPIKANRRQNSGAASAALAALLPRRDGDAARRIVDERCADTTRARE